MKLIEGRTAKEIRVAEKLQKEYNKHQLEIEIELQREFDKINDEITFYEIASILYPCSFG